MHVHTGERSTHICSPCTHIQTRTMTCNLLLVTEPPHAVVQSIVHLLEAAHVSNIDGRRNQYTESYLWWCSILKRSDTSAQHKSKGRSAASHMKMPAVQPESSEIPFSERQIHGEGQCRIHADSWHHAVPCVGNWCSD